MSDIAVGMTAVPFGAPKIRKPYYLLELKVDRRTKESRFFISLDKPSLLNGFVEVKGIFIDSSASEEELLKNFDTILTSTPKELFLEMMFPWHRICSVRNLVFKAK